MPDKSICRIGVFYDGSFFVYAQNYFYGKKLGWLHFPAFHTLIENFLRDKEQSYQNYRVVYAGWYQGLFTSSQADAHQLKIDRNRHIDLMYAGIEPKFVPMSKNQGEKGVDVALAVDAMQICMSEKIDIAVLVTGDGDFVPLVRSIMKYGVRVAAVYFEYKDAKRNSYINDRLLNVCNYSLNINSLDGNRNTPLSFKSLFKDLPLQGENSSAQVKSRTSTFNF